MLYAVDARSTLGVDNETVRIHCSEDIGWDCHPRKPATVR